MARSRLHCPFAGSSEPVEIEVSAWAVHHADPDSHPFRYGVRWERCCAPAISLALFALWLLALLLMPQAAVFLFAFPLFFIPQLAWLWTHRSVEPAVARLMDLPAPMPQFPVHVSFIRGGHVYGFDEGVAAFNDQWLHYRGLRTDFHFGRIHAAPAWTSTGLMLDYGLHGVPFRVVVHACDEIRGANGRYLRQFFRDAGEWLKLPPGKAGIPTLPPLQPQEA